MKSIGERIKSMREKRGLSQTELAKLAGMKQNTFFYLENGNTKNSARLHKIAEILGVNIEWLETGIGNPTVTEYSKETVDVIKLMETQTDDIGRGKCLYAVREIVEVRAMIKGGLNIALSDAQIAAMKNQVKNWEFNAPQHQNPAQNELPNNGAQKSCQPNK